LIAEGLIVGFRCADDFSPLMLRLHDDYFRFRYYAAGARKMMASRCTMPVDIVEIR